MFKLIEASLVFYLLVSCQIKFGSAELGKRSLFSRILYGKNYEKIYQMINDYLVKNLSSEEIGPNVAQALEWLEIEGEQANPNDDLANALIDFTSLILINGTNTCNGKSYEILHRNDLATRGRARIATKKRNRVENIINSVAIKHAVECRDTYPAIFERKLAQFDGETLRRIEVFTGNFLARYATHFVRQELEFLKRHFIDTKAISFAAKQDTIDALKGLISLTDHSELSSVKDHERSAIERLFQKYVFEPCNSYVLEFGPEVFLPAAFDDETLMAGSGSSGVGGDNFLNYYKGWAQYRVCEALKGSEKRLIDKVVTLSKDEISVAMDSRSQ